MPPMTHPRTDFQNLKEPSSGPKSRAVRRTTSRDADGQETMTTSRSLFGDRKVVRNTLTGRRCQGRSVPETGLRSRTAKCHFDLQRADATESWLPEQQLPKQQQQQHKEHRQQRRDIRSRSNNRRSSSTRVVRQRAAGLTAEELTQPWPHNPAKHLMQPGSSSCQLHSISMQLARKETTATKRCRKASRESIRSDVPSDERSLNNER